MRCGIAEVSRAVFVCLTGKPAGGVSLLHLCAPPVGGTVEKTQRRPCCGRLWEWMCFYAGLQTDVRDHDAGQRGGHKPPDQGPAQVRGAVYLLLRSGTRAAVTRKTSAGIRRWSHFFSRSTGPYRVDPLEPDRLLRRNFRAVLVKSDGHSSGPL